MYCSQCGKKIAETMLFCPFCGTPIVIPDQDETVQETPDESAPSVPEKELPPIHLFEDVEEEPKEEFVPLDMERLLKEDVSEEESLAEESKNEKHVERETVRRTSSKTSERTSAQKTNHSKTNHSSTKKGSTRKKPNTYVPQREFNPDDIFMDKQDQWGDEEEKAYRYEDEDEGGFVVRHIRGLVSLLLFVVMIAVILGWVLSSSGQKTLARAGIAWSASAYNQLAYEAYESGSYAQAGVYYGKALDLDPDEYNYAYNAGVSYYLAQDTSRAEEMAYQAIEIDPTRSEAYQLLLYLYPDADSRTEEVAALLQQGYEQTGDESLNQN